MNFEIQQIDLADANKIKSFTDKWIGLDYYSEDEIKDIVANNFEVSFKVVDEFGEIAGIRLTLKPGAWIEKDQYKDSITPSVWRVDANKVGYFKSLFIGEKYQNMGLGKKLSQLSMQKLKEHGAQAVICHSWIQSPNDSSRKYLSSLGFEALSVQEKFWYDIDYDCTRCGSGKCVCDAQEMIKYL